MARQKKGNVLDNESVIENDNEEFECVNCSWIGTELSKSCKTRGNIETIKKDGFDVEVHKTIKGIQRCDGCSFLDNKCPVCGDNVGKLGIKEVLSIERENLEAEKAKNHRGYAYV